MPIDSRKKRAGAAGVHWMPGVVVPDGTIDAGDRAVIAGVYPLPAEEKEFLIGILTIQDTRSVFDISF